MPDQMPAQILVVDDEEFNRDILREYLEDAGYKVTLACDGEEAWSILDSTAQNFNTILLDRMMPSLDGMGLLKRIMTDKRLQNIPVIFQTAADSTQQISEGLQAGASYYLTKPFSKEVMLAIVQSAVSYHAKLNPLLGDGVLEKRRSDLLQQRSEFVLRTLADAHRLASTLTWVYPNPQRALLGLYELMINAVEHGNLGITYKEKTMLLQAGMWENEINRRLILPQNIGKDVHVLLEQMPDEISLTVTDCGKGFEWQKYLEMSPERAFDPNGRGIALSRMMSFDSVEYLGTGNQVVAKVKLQTAEANDS